MALFVANLKLCSRDSSLQEALTKFNPWKNVLDFIFWVIFLLKKIHLISTNDLSLQFWHSTFSVHMHSRFPEQFSAARGDLKMIKVKLIFHYIHVTITPPPLPLNIFEAHSDKTWKVSEQRKTHWIKVFCSMSPALYLFLPEMSVNISLHLFPHSFFATCCLSKLVDREFVICSHPSFKVLHRTAQVLKRRIKFYILNKICHVE